MTKDSQLTECKELSDHEFGWRSVGGSPGHPHTHFADSQVCLKCGKSLREIVDSQLQAVFEEIEKTRKTESVIRQAEVAMKNKNYSLMQIRYIVKGYNKAIKDVLSLRQKYIPSEKEEK